MAFLYISINYVCVLLPQLHLDLVADVSLERLQVRGDLIRFDCANSKTTTAVTTIVKTTQRNVNVNVNVNVNETKRKRNGRRNVNETSVSNARGRETKRFRPP
jgi:hypothetical protein